MDHIFIAGHFSKNVMKFFATSCGVHNDVFPLHNYIMN